MELSIGDLLALSDNNKITRLNVEDLNQKELVIENLEGVVGMTLTEHNKHNAIYKTSRLQYVSR